MQIRVLIVAAYASVRAGLEALLADAEDCAIVGAVSGSDELERILLDAPPDVVLFDDNESDRRSSSETRTSGGSTPSLAPEVDSIALANSCLLTLSSSGGYYVHLVIDVCERWLSRRLAGSEQAPEPERLGQREQSQRHDREHCVAHGCPPVRIFATTWVFAASATAANIEAAITSG